jgi:hypothetical protein
MSETARLVWLLLITRRAHALIVVDQILASSWIASTQRAVGDVLARPHARRGNVLLEATIANALEVLQVVARGVRLILAFSMRATLVVRRYAIVVVLAFFWV